MNKVKNFLLNKGVYLIAIGCVAVICLSGLYLANLSEKEEYTGDNGVISATEEAQDVIALPTRKAESPDISVTPETTPGVTPSSTPAESTVTDTSSEVNTIPEIRLQLPVAGQISVDYAMDKLVYNKTLDEWRTHSGVDILADLDTEVKAAGDGKVIDVKKDPRLGRLIIVEHNSEIKSIYANLKEETNVKIGDVVKQGDVLGWIGNTAPFEYSEEPHIHFEILLKDVCTNVWNYVDKVS